MKTLNRKGETPASKKQNTSRRILEEDIRNIRPISAQGAER